MTWDDRLARLLEDLEQQADGLAMAERDAQVAELSRAEYAQVDLAGRLHASVGRRLQVGVTGAGTVDGSLARVGQGWCLLEVGTAEWIVRLPAVGSVRGLSDRSVGAQARPLGARLGVASALRGVGESGGEAVVLRLDGGSARGTLGRVGADFVDLRLGEGRSGHLETVPFAALAAVRTA
jgi:hypothetical protein